MTKALELAKFGRETPPAGVVVGDSDTQTLSSKTFSDGPVFSSGTVNSVPFLNASKVFSTAATFVFDGTNLGIGVASPGYMLHVKGGAIAATSADGTVTSTFNYNTIGTITNSDFVLNTNSTERARISSTGLQVTGALSVSTGVTAGATSGYTAGNIFVYDASGVARIGSNAGSTLRLFSNGVNAVDFNNAGTPTFNVGAAVTGALSATGNVGIGTTSPSQKLHVQSASNAQGLFKTTGAGGGSNRSSVILESPSNTWYINTNGSDLNGSDGALGFYGNSATRMVIDTSGNVGIGTNLPAVKLDVVGAASATGVIKSTSNTNGQFHSLPATTSAAASFLAQNAGGTAYFGKNNNGGGAFGGTTYSTVVYSGGNVPMQFYTNDAVRATLDSAGNLGIGTITPIAQLGVYGTGQTTANISTSSGLGGTLYVRDSAAGAGNGGVVMFGANQGAFAAIKGLLTDGANNSAGALAISTRNLTTDATLTERLRITSAGGVGIANTDPDGYGSKLAVGGNISATTGNNVRLWDSANTTYVQMNVPSARSIRWTNDASTEYMRIDSVGSLGVGVSNPSSFGKFVAYSSGGYGAVDANGHFNSAQLLDVASAGGRLTGSSSVGILGSIGIEQTTTGSTGGYILFRTCASGTVTQTERARIDSSGNVGIGTSTINTKLHIAESSDVAFTLSNSSSVTSGNRGSLAMVNSANSTVGLIRFLADTDNVGTEIQFYTRPIAGALTQTMTLTATGRLGIGTTAPTNMLDVRGTNPIIRVEPNVSTGAASFQAINDSKISYFGRENSVGDYFFSTNVTPYSTVLSAYNSTAPIIFGHSSPEVFILNGGNVGIGTSSPAQKLQVNGAIYANNSTNVAFLMQGSQYNGSIANTSSANTYSLGYTTNASTHTSVLYWNASGNVGIGLPSPTEKLHIAGIAASGSTQGPRINLQYTGTAGDAESLVNFLDFRGNKNAAIGNNLEDDSVGNYAARLVFKTAVGGTLYERMRITSAGNVGIGTSSPVRPLQVGNYGVTNGEIALASTTNGFGSILFGDGATTTDVYRGYIQYDHASDAMLLATSTTIRAMITSGGNLLVGTTSGITNGGFSFEPNYNGTGISAAFFGHSITGGNGNQYCVFGFNGTFIGTITQSGTTAVAYNTSSDYRLKNSIAPMTSALAKVALLKPCTYKWNADGSDGQGFIAHELAEVCPDAVSGAKDAVDDDGNIKPQGIDTSFLVATLTAAIQEQQAIIQSLKARLDAANL